MMSNTKRPPDHDSSSSPNPPRKVPKLKHNASTTDYSSDVRKKLQSSNRTGQACDRCRMRKMRCDGRPDGCAPCTQNQTPCQTTDRMTGIANERGHAKRLERRIGELENYIRGLEGRLMSLGEDVKPYIFESDPTAALPQWSDSREHGAPVSWETASHGAPETYPLSRTPPLGPDNPPDCLPMFRDGLSGDNYLGVSSGNPFISSIQGTALNVLGSQIDLADYMSADLDDPNPPVLRPEYQLNKSYHAFVQTAYSSHPNPKKVPLPPLNEGMTYAQWYFRMINPYMPFLHKPSFLRMLSKVYDVTDPFEPSIAEVTMIHMLFAIMYFQYASRNWQNAGQQSGLNDLSNRHYHYALSFFPQLVASHTLQDVQALTMIALHMRTFPKPGPCWMLSSTTLHLAIELGLHRSAERWPSTAPKRSTLEIEMRKRTFWSIALMHVLTCGKLGRPMPLREEDLDIELPQAMDDDLLSEQGLDASKTGKCDFLVAIEGFKILPTLIDMYGSIYGIKRSSQHHVENVQRLEKRFRDWREQWPNEVKVGSPDMDEEGRVHSQWLVASSLEFRLLLRHPSLSMTSSVEFSEENLAVCLELSEQLLQHVKILQSYKSLDTSWQCGAMYVLAISTTLFGHWKRAEQSTRRGLGVLRKDMGDWLSIMGDISELLGSGKRLQTAVRAIVDKTLYTFEQQLSSQANPAALSSPVRRRTPSLPSNTLMSVQPGFYKSPSTYVHYGEPPGSAGSSTRYHLRPSSDGSDIAAQTVISYASPTQYSFPGSATSYASSTGPYAPTAYTPSDPLSAGSQPVSAAPTNSYMYAAVSPDVHSSYQHGINVGYPTTPVSSWREWTGHMATNIPSQPQPQEYINSATALMQLGARQGNEDNTAIGAGTDLSGVDQGGTEWPHMIFDANQPGG